MMKRPTLSVVMPCYNHGHFISEALDAILMQTWPADQIVVLNDGSTDNSLEIINDYAKRHKSIDVISYAENIGVMSICSVGEKATWGEYIYYASADDKVLSDSFFEKSLKLLQLFPKAPLCTSFHSTLDDATGEISINSSNWTDKASFLSPEKLIDVNCVGIAGHASIYKRELINGVGYLDSSLKWYTDWFASLALAFRDGICYIPESLAAIRVVKDSYSCSKNKNTEERLEPIRNIIKKLCLPEYAYLLKAFEEAGTMSVFKEEIALILEEATFDPEFLLTKVLRIDLGPLLFWRLAHVWKSLVENASGKVALYGAGQHTQWLLGAVADIGYPDIFCIYDDAPRVSEINNIPVRSINYFHEDAGELWGVVICSDFYEEEMFETIRRIKCEVKIIRPCMRMKEAYNLKPDKVSLDYPSLKGELIEGD